MKAYNVTHLPQTLRVNLNFDLTGYYVLVVPDPTKSPVFRDFYLVKDETGETVFMHGVDVVDDGLAVEVAIMGASVHIDKFQK